MHFLKKVIETPILDNPAKNYVSVHRHFYRYSKGEFNGPALKVSQTSSKITLKGSHEYEDLIIELVARTLSQDDVEINGILITGGDISKIISDLGFDWKFKKSSGQIINYKSEISDTINKNILLKSIDTFRDHGYFLISFNVSSSNKVTTKKKIPQPSKKKVDEDDINARIQFCSGFINNNEKNLNLVMEETLPDFKSEITNRWKSITISNNYIINDIELPKDVKNSLLLRTMALRKGLLVRSIDVDGELMEKQYKIIV